MLPLTLLVASLASLVIGPALATRLGKSEAFASAFSAFCAVVTLGLLVTHILPQSFATAESGSLAAAALGLIAVSIFEGTARKPASSFAFCAFMSVGLAAHGVLDGMALSGVLDAEHSQGFLGLAVLLHQVPMAAALWLSYSRRAGTRWRVVLLASLGSGIVVGFFGGGVVGAAVGPTVLGLIQAAMAGALAHGLLHLPSADSASERYGSGIGAIAAMFCVWFLTRDHPIVSMLPSELSAGHAFLHLLLDSGPALLVGFIATAAIGFLGSERAARWLARGNAFTQTAKAICVAPFLPFCSCGVLPVYRTLILTGAAPTAAIAFLVATPELNVTALAYSSTLLGWKVTLLRIALALVAACLVGLVVARILPKTAVAALPQAAAVAPPTSLRVRTRSALEFGFVESVQHVMPFVLLGLFVAALCEPFLDPASIARMPAGLDVAVLTVIGIPAYVCASGATPLAAVLIHKGISVGAVLAFMLTGPASNVTTVGMLARLHGKKTALGFVLGMCVVAIGAGFAVNLFVPNPTTAWSMHGNEERESSLVAWLSVAVLAALTTHVLLREGLAGFLAALRSPGAHPVHAHGSCADPTCADHPSPLAPPAVISPLVLDSVFASGSITVKKLQVQPRRAYVSTPPK